MASKSNKKTAATIDSFWGGLGLCRRFFTIPEVFLTDADALGLTPTDVFFVIKAIVLQKNRTVPYADRIGLDPKTVTTVKKRLVAAGFMRDQTTKAPGKKPRPRYDFTGLFQVLAARTSKEANWGGESCDEDGEATSLPPALPSAPRAPPSPPVRVAPVSRPVLPRDDFARLSSVPKRPPTTCDLPAAEGLKPLAVGIGGGQCASTFDEMLDLRRVLSREYTDWIYATGRNTVLHDVEICNEAARFQDWVPAETLRAAEGIRDEIVARNTDDLGTDAAIGFIMSTHAETFFVQCRGEDSERLRSANGDSSLPLWPPVAD